MAPVPAPPVFPSADGALSAAIALAASLGAAVAILLASRRFRLGEAGAWLALVIAGFGAALVSVDAPPAVTYQHYRLAAGDLLHIAAWAILCVQAVALCTRGRRHLAGLVTPARGRWLAIIVAFGLVVITAAAPSRAPAMYAGELALAAVVELVSLGTIIAALRSIPDEALRAMGLAGDRFLGRRGTPGPSRIDAWVLRLATAAVVVAAFLGWTAYQDHPHVPDEVVYLIHARYFAKGMLWMPAPPVPAAFNLDLMQFEPSRWYSPVPPGWPAVLAIGVLAHAPWLVNPLLGGVAIVLAYLVLGDMYDRRTTRLAVLFLAGSPWFLFMAMNVMTHTLSLVLALAATLGIARARRTGRTLPAFAGGLATGAVSLVRPLEGLAVAALLGLWSLGARGRRFRFTPSVALVAGAMMIGAVVRPYNAVLTGAASKFPIMAYDDKYYGPGTNDLGFGPNRGLNFGGNDPFPGHGLPDVIVNTLFNGFQVNVELLGWPTGAMFLLALPLAFGWTRLSRADRWQLAVIVLIVAIHAFYWFSGGPDFGARYWYLIIVPCVALAARGVERLGWEETAPYAARPQEGAPSVRSVAAALVLVAAAVAVFVPWRAVGKYRHYRGMRPDVRLLAREQGFGRSLILIRGRRFPDYASAAVYNPIGLDGDSPVYAWDARRTVRDSVIRAYPDRSVWIVDGPSLTHATYRIAAGPLSTAQALAIPLPVDLAGDEIHAYDPVHPPPLGMRH